MFVKIGDETVNLKQVRSVNQNDGDTTMMFNLLSDYDYEVKMSPSDAESLFQKAGIKIIKINKTDFLIEDNVLFMYEDGDEVSITYKDGSDESFSGSKIPSGLDSVKLTDMEDETEDDESNIDIPKRNEVISSDLQIEREESKTAWGVQVFIGAVALGIILYQIIKSGMIKF